MHYPPHLLVSIAAFALFLVLGSHCGHRVVAAEDFAQGGRILLIGDSILDCLEGADRVEKVMLQKLQQRYPQAEFAVVNKARGGMWIGPADTAGITGISIPLFDTDTTGWYFDIRKEVPEADAIVVLFAGNDGKVYSPAVFGQKLATLCDRLAADYTRARIVLATGMYLDPQHSAGYYRTPSMVPGFVQGSNRNEYLKPYYDEARRLARQRGYLLAEACERIKAETEAGNWDLRMRGDGTLDASKDAEHAGDLNWFTDIHPNPRGTAIIADVLVKTLLGEDALKPD